MRKRNAQRAILPDAIRGCGVVGANMGHREHQGDVSSFSGGIMAT